MQNINNTFEESHIGLTVAVSLAVVVLVMFWVAFMALAAGIAVV